MASRSFVLLVAGQREAPPEAPVRLGITVSRRVGNAVVRARVKRNVREWFRRNRALAPAGRDIVVIAKPVAARASSQEVWRELARSFQRLASSECA